MPWQVQPDHPAVMVYPRQAELNVELQKLYALGIDALRLGLVLLAGETRVDLDGVTGLLRLDLTRDARVDRLPLLAEYRDGVLGVAAPR
jgi:outer membrane PBP1 activator LpoA protein